jgi:hypothetical protein
MKRAPMVEKMKVRLKNNPNVNLVDFNIPRDNGLTTPKLRDILEEDVEDKYYLDNQVVERIAKEADFQEKLVSFKQEK